MQLAKGYGAEVDIKAKKPEKLFTVTIVKETTGRKIWNVRRCRKNFLAKKKYTKDSNGKYIYSGCSNVVITTRTPVTITYHTKNKKASVSFFIQRYDDQDVAVDAVLQAKIDG